MARFDTEQVTKSVGQAFVAGGVPAASYLSNLALWVTIFAGLISSIWVIISIVKAVFPKHFERWVARLEE